MTRVTRTHAWGEAAFAWPAPALAVDPAIAGRGSRSVHADGALVAWDDASGTVRAVLSRGEAARSARFLRAGVVVVARATSIEVIEPDGVTVRWSQRSLSQSSDLIVASDAESFALVPPYGFATCRAMSPITGEVLESSGPRERWIALGPGVSRVAVVEVPDPRPPAVTGRDAAGDPLYAPSPPPTYELRVQRNGGVVIARRPVDAAAVSGGYVTARIDAEGQRAFVWIRERREAIDLATGDPVAWRDADVPQGSPPQLGPTPSADPARVHGVALDPAGTYVAWCRGPDVDVAQSPPTEIAVASARGDDGVRRATIFGWSHVVLSMVDDAPRVFASANPVREWRCHEDDAPAPRADLPGSDAMPWRVSPSGQLLLLRSGSSKLWVCERATGRVVATTVYTGGISEATFTDDERTLLVAHGEQISRLDVADSLRWRSHWTVRDVPARLAVALGQAVALVADHRTGDDLQCRPHLRKPWVARLRVLELAPGEPHAAVRVELRQWPLAPGVEPILAISRDGRVGLDAMKGEPELRIWDLVAGARIDALSLALENDAPVHAAASDDGTVFVVGTARGRVLRYRVEPG